MGGWDGKVCLLQKHNSVFGGVLSGFYRFSTEGFISKTTTFQPP